MKRIFTLSMLTLLVLGGLSAQNYRKWDFTNWSATTINNLKADAAASSTTGWSDIEKAADAGEGKVAPEATAGKCFWLQDNTMTTLKANGAEIAETEGLVFNATYAGNRSVAIAIDYPSTSLGEYAGPQYLWLGGGGKSVACFTIQRVRIGQKITMEVESHKTTDARGVELYVGSVDAANKIGESFKPTVKDTYTWQEGWTLPEGATANADGETVDIIVYNTSGCHIYSMEIGDDSQKSKVAYLYNGSTDSELALSVIDGTDSYTVEAIEATGAFTLDQLTAYDAVVISSTVTNAEAISSLKSIFPFVPTLNLNPALYDTWGYGAIDTSAAHQFATLADAGHALFRGLELVSDEDTGITGLQLTQSGEFNGVTLGEYFGNDLILGTVMDSEVVAIHGHNLSHNGYLFIPYTQETLADAANPLILRNAIKVLTNSKTKVSAAPKPTIKLTYKNKNTDVTITSGVPGAEIFYTLDGSEPTEQSTRYTEPFNISTEGVTVKAAVKGDGYLLSEAAEQAVDLKEQAQQPTIALEQQDGKTVVTLTTEQVGGTIYYNYDGRNTQQQSTPYSGPFAITIPGRTISAFTVAEGVINSELAQQAVPVSNAKVRIDVLSHMDANAADYNGGSTSTAYYFSWGKDKAAHPYYNPDVYTEEQSEDPETGDEVVTLNYTELNEEEEKDFGTGWLVRSRGQLIDWENLTTGENYGDHTGYNFATVDDKNPYFPVTKCIINLADKNTTPNGVSFPYNAYIATTEKYTGPFDVVLNVGSIVKPADDGSATAKHHFVVEVSADGNQWDSNWQVLGDTIKMENMNRLTKNYTRSYEGSEPVYVRVYLANNNSKIGLYDIFIANHGDLSQELETGIVAVRPENGLAQPAAVYDLNGRRLNSLQRGLNIVRYSDGTARKVMVK